VPNHRRALLAACVALAFGIRAPAKAASDAPIDVFLIAGQSNASGIPGRAEESPKVPPGAVLQFYQGRISDGNDPVGNARPGSAWPSFGVTYYAETGRRVLFVPAAAPATSLLPRSDFWRQGHWDESGKLFAKAVKQADDALAAAGPKARFAGVLWDQGEADAVGIGKRRETAAQYEHELRKLIVRFRAHFGAGAPFYIFETGDGDPPQGFAQVRAAQERVSRTTPGAPIVFTEAASYPARGLMAKDGIHYSQPGYNRMGRLGALAIAGAHGQAGRAPALVSDRASRPARRAATAF
jgi:hypothetical protein